MTEPKPPRPASSRHRSERLPPPTRENWLGLGLMVATTVSMPVAVYGTGVRGGIEATLTLVPMLILAAYYVLLGLGMWLVRPVKGHRLLYRIAFAYLHLQAACYLLMWSQSAWGGLPNPFRPSSAYAIAANFFTVFGFLPAFALRKRSRDWALLFWVEIIVPFFVVASLAFVAVTWLVVRFG